MHRTVDGPDEVRRLVAAGESFVVELKGERYQPLSDSALVEAVVCLANGNGGTLLVGVEDDGTITGARPRHESGSTDVFRVQALLANRTVPPVQTLADVIVVDGHDVLVIEVEDAPRVVGTSRGLYVRRAMTSKGQPECVAFPAHEMLARDIDRGATDYAHLPVQGATWDDLDPLEFERVRSMVVRAGASADPSLRELSDVDIARALGVVGHDDGQVLSGAVLLFGRPASIRRLLPTHQAFFQVVRGTSVSVNDDVTGPLFAVAEDLRARLRPYSSEQELTAGMLRVAVSRLPDEVVREVVANALVHRDYTALGPVTVQLTDDVLEVTSPGGLPPGIRLDNLLTAQRPRSPVLADAFKRVGLVDRTGRGINRVFESLLRAGRDGPDFTRTTSESVSVAVPTGDADLALTRFVLDSEARHGSPFRLGELQVLHELRREGRLTTADVAPVLQVSEVQGRAVLSAMVERGLIDSRGSGRGRSYHLSAAAYRAVGAPGAYPRVHGVDRLQQEQLVLAYALAHGSIARSDAAELCSITPEQAGPLLRRLVAEGRLAMTGSRRWARYVLPGQHG